MDAYRLLRQQAATKRDLAIAEARRIYRDDIQRIEALERSIPPVEPFNGPLGKPATIIDMIRALVPPDTPFTVPEMIDWMRAKHDGLRFKDQTIGTHLSKLARRGVIRRLYRTGDNYSLWIAAESRLDDGPIDTKSVAEVANEILRERGPLTVTELAVEMQGRGYRVEVKPQALMRAIRDMFKYYRGRFVRDAKGQWTAI